MYGTRLKKSFVLLALLTIFTVVLSSCGGAATPPPAAEEPAAEAPAATQEPAAEAPAATEEPAAEAPAATEEAAAEEPAAADKPLKIALSLPDMSFPFFVFMETQVREEAEALGNIEIITLDGQNQVPKQTADMEAAIAQEYDGVLISPITADAMAPAVQQVVDAGIPIVTIDRSVTGVNTLAHAGADNVLGGEQQGQVLLELFPDGATIFELEGEPGSSPAIDRSKGLHNIIDGVANIQVACKQTANFRRDKGLSVTESCLGATPEPDAVVAANDEMAFGAIEAFKAAGLTDVVVIGYDALPEALQLVQSGELYATVDQFPGDQSQVALRTLVDFLRKGTEPTEHDIFITPKLITKDNMDEAERIAEIGGAPAATEEAMAEATEEAVTAEGEPLTIALSLPDMSFPFFVFMETQVREEAEALGNIEIITLDGQNQVPKQTADMEAAIAQEYDGVLISPITADAMAPAVQQVVDAGIPIVTIDRSVTGVNTLAHAGADNVLGGEQQGQVLLELFPDGATIFELEGEPGSSPAIDRSKGLHNIIDGVANIQVACKQTANFRRDKGLSVTESCLGATPEPDAVVAANDEMAFGAIEAFKAAGLTDVVVIGYDALPEALQLVQSGELYATVDQFPGDQSQVALRTLVDFLRAGTEPTEHDIFITPKLITKDNMDEAERIGEIQ